MSGNQKGGQKNESPEFTFAPGEMPMYKEPAFSPFVPNEEKAINIAKKYPPAEPVSETKPTSTFDKNKVEAWQGTTVAAEDNQWKEFTKNDQSRSTTYNRNVNNIAKTHDFKNPMPPVLSLEFYDPTANVKPKAPEPNPFVPIGVTPFGNVPQYYNPALSCGYNQIPNYGIPVIKNYTINAGPAIDANHAKIHDIYAEILPTKDVANTPNTIGERLNMYQFIRSVFVKQGDGEDIDLSSKSVNGLLRHLKTIELNPNNPNLISDNPYMGLPDNMLLYKSCYPIRYNASTNTTECAAASLGMNIRIYGLSIAEFLTRNVENQEYYKFDTWREIAYYEYVRENIIKQKVCPNFVLMHAYFVALEALIDFVKLNMLKNSRSDMSNYFIGNQVIQQSSLDNYYATNWMNELMAYYNRTTDLTSIPVLPYLNKTMTKEGYFRMVKPIVDNNMFLKNYSGKALVSFTEAPTYNLLDWASKKYRRSDNFKVHEMTNSGFHDVSIWKSVIFQIMAALATLQIHKISFTNFSVIDNIYIQDTKTHPNNTMHWKYIINGVEYYVPNYGFLVLIDSNFKDIKSEYSTNHPVNKVYKINSSIFDDLDNDIIANKDDIQRDSIKAFLNVINSNTFSNSFVTNGGTKPPEDILRMLSNINNDVNNMLRVDKDIKLTDVIFKHANFYMNNRIGTILKNEEITSIQKTNTEKFIPGQIVVREFRNDTYDFVLFKEYVTDSDDASITNNKARILTDLRNPGNKKQLVEITVDTGSIFNYSIHDKINQDFVNKLNLSEENLLETYIINDQ